MTRKLDLNDINAHADFTQSEAKLRKEQKDAVYKKYGFYENYKLVIDPEGMRQFLVDEGFTHSALKEFLSSKHKQYYKGISQAIMYQALTKKGWKTKILSEEQIVEAVSAVFPDQQATQEVIENEISHTHEEIMETVLDSKVLVKREALISALKDKFGSAKQCADAIASVSQKHWRDIEILPHLSMREVVDAIVLNGKHVQRPTNKNVSIISVKELLDIVWNLPVQKEELHILEKSIGDMLYKELKVIAPDPVAFCNRFLGEYLTEVAGYPLQTVGRFLGLPKWKENTDATITVMLDVWKSDPSALRIQQYRKDRPTLTEDLIESKAPAILLTDYSLQRLLGIHRPYTKDPQLLRRKINDVLGIIRL